MRTDEVNVILIIAVVSWVLAQLLKTLIDMIKTHKFSAERLTGSGGMPSAHSATVCSLAIATCRVCGICSAEFALAMVLAMVVMYDATGVRRAAGLHAKAINQLRRVVNELDEEFMDRFDDKIDDISENDEEDIKELKEYLGHTPLEVLCGALLGILVAMAFPIVSPIGAV